MKKGQEYSDEPLGEIRIVNDFLPPPEELVLKEEETVKVTIALSRSSVEFFKAKAAQHNTKYQRMIRYLLDHYAEQHRGHTD